VVAAGTHTVSELLPVAGSDLESIICEDPTGDSSGDPATGVATFTAAPAENITCTFVNVARGRIIVRKVIEGPASPQEFPFVSNFDGDISDGTDFTLAGGQSFDSGPLVPGTFAVNEIVPDGWSLVSAACDDGSPIAAIVLAAGETVTCTFTDERVPTPYDTYDDDPGAPDFDFDTPFDDTGTGSGASDNPVTEVAGASQNQPDDSPSASGDQNVAVDQAGWSGGDQNGDTSADPDAGVGSAVSPLTLSSLPRTGTAPSQLLTLGFLLMALGVVTLGTCRRRRNEVPA
jgi:LPXTG-motif cell wall-anchored protein